MLSLQRLIVLVFICYGSVACGQGNNSNSNPGGSDASIVAMDAGVETVDSGNYFFDAGTGEEKTDAGFQDAGNALDAGSEGIDSGATLDSSDAGSMPDAGEPITFIIGGTLAGLNGTLILQNNGGDDLTLSENGSFSFSNGLLSGADYSVIAVSYPSNQGCTVHFESGKVVSEKVDNIEIVCVTAPIVMGTSPESPANNNSVNVYGSTDQNLIVGIYSDNQCIDDPIAIGSSDTFMSSGIELIVADNATYHFFARSSDEYGNMSNCSETYANYQEDSLSPNTIIDSAPSIQSHDSVASFSFDSSEAGIFQCSLDSGSFTICTSPTTYSSLSAGSHAFEVFAIDVANNIDATPALQTWNIDFTAPVTTLNDAPSGTKTTNDAVFSFSASESDTFECQIDSGSFSSCISPKSYSGLANGSHTFKVRAVDTAGNVDASPPTASWTVAQPILYYPLNGTATNAGTLGSAYDGSASGVSYVSGEKSSAAYFGSVGTINDSSCCMKIALFESGQ